MSRVKIIRVRVSDAEYERLFRYAKKMDVSASDIMRDLIKRLPKD